MRPHLGRCLVLAALGGAGVLACGVAQAAPKAAPQAAPAWRPSDGGSSLGRPLFGGQFDPVGGNGGGVVAGGGRLLVTRAGGGA
ncbi:hypothetical protein DY245_00585 [Streptomyces inhibens]|uniref:Uncharacterized protein n=1 Tax=Streptomyces inhibens TaxID=2293571 RepID=A0A371QBV8_STRIH|nr:hypothetical protein [Streptomyces inhibens]REK92182.1 hypothetical protein DY245_00585 [Streptomyces inhibens]